MHVDLIAFIGTISVRSPKPVGGTQRGTVQRSGNGHAERCAE